MAEIDTGGKHPFEDHKKDPKASIPLWLQGLAESDPTAGQEEPVEMPGAEMDEDTDQVVSESESSGGPVNNSETLPDWLSEIAASDDETTEMSTAPKKSMAEPERADARADEAPFDQTPEQEGPDTIKAEDNKPDLDGAPYVELSEMDVEDEMIPEEEDLPDWLTDMITEAPEQEEPAPQKAEGTDETFADETEPEMDDGSGWQRLEGMPAGWVPFDDTTPVNLPEEKEAAEWLKEEAEEDTSPIQLEATESEAREEAKNADMDTSKNLTEDTGSFVPIQPFEVEEVAGGLEETAHTADDEIDSTAAEDEPEDSREEPDGSMPKTLQFAKFILDQGELDRALEIISTYIGQSTYLDEIEDWVTEAIESGAHQNAGLWETVGDIAVAREEYSEALNAYAKAMKILLHREEGQNEVN